MVSMTAVFRSYPGLEPDKLDDGRSFLLVQVRELALNDSNLPARRSV